MAQKTWFLPPSFNFRPDGELALGTVIEHPKTPTRSLVSLAADHPDIILPRTDTLIERAHNHSGRSVRSTVVELCAKIVEFASARGKSEFSKYKTSSFGPVDVESRSYNGKISADALKQIVGLEKVKKHIRGGKFHNRPVYIISGLMVSMDSFQVGESAGSGNSVLLTGSVPAGIAPVEVGSGVSATKETNNTSGYLASPGIVVGFRVHMIRSGQTELFSHRAAFHTGGEDDEEEEEELECKEVGAEIDLGFDFDVKDKPRKVEFDGCVDCLAVFEEVK